MHNPTKTGQVRLILASSSPYRKAQLQQLITGFECIHPHLDETPLPGENPDTLVERLAFAKASQIAILNPEAIVLGSDQAAILGDQVLGKPGSREKACQQLAMCSGKTVRFETAVSIVQQTANLEKVARVTTQVKFRELDDDEIFRYVEKDNPVDCAGSFKIESAGPVLFQRVVSNDPTALIGLPLIQTASMLRLAGLQLP